MRQLNNGSSTNRLTRTRRQHSGRKPDVPQRIIEQKEQPDALDGIAPGFAKKRVTYRKGQQDQARTEHRKADVPADVSSIA